MDTYRVHLHSDEFQLQHEINVSAVEREDGWTVLRSDDDVLMRVRDEHIVSLERLV